ncbi:putative anti-sigma-YlaC factor YlaD [Stackebrandtia albiflava]|uniref:Putative anti-sigma-YlaC factor YlaD n=1 Tax=Stackebrandtia albiflava TaxID=406432 RepID=A0A562V4M1_9ACTN|nr:zf-HC2 domain-containing protein [Stackebrandtia albiflava]TWJ12768.1 putative anti-sigma-YlaC factor YlaD [Stackebrandtia albiflava]
MTCAKARAAVSALLDGESVDDRPAVSAHLAACPDCVGWRARAETVGLRMRGAFDDVPDLTTAVLSAATERERRDAVRRRAQVAGRRRVLRWAVGVAAVVQLTLAIPALLTAAGVTDLAAVHTSREMASFDIAVAVGFLLAAVRPERARAFVPVAVVLAACLGMTSMLDVASGLTGIVDEAGHLVALVQAGLLWALGRVPVDTSTSTRPVTT